MKPYLSAKLASVLIPLFLFGSVNARAHCDSLDGPVVDAARLALKMGDVTPTLKWVNKEGEKEVREAFAQALKVRALREDARDLADTHFFETLVRLHRAGEGMPFTGLKPAEKIDPGLLAADKALQARAIDKLSEDLTKSIQETLRARFEAVLEKKKHQDDSIEAGRAYVAAYVKYAHFVEAINSAGPKTAEDHHTEPAENHHK